MLDNQITSPNFFNDTISFKLFKVDRCVLFCGNGANLLI